MPMRDRPVFGAFAEPERLSSSITRSSIPAVAQKPRTFRLAVPETCRQFRSDQLFVERRESQVTRGRTR